MTPAPDRYASPPPSVCSVAEGLVHAMLGDPNSAVPRILQYVAETLNAFGCVLWEAQPGSNIDVAPPTGCLFVLAEWFSVSGTFFALHDLPIEGTATGGAVCSGQPTRLDDVQMQGGKTRNHDFLRKNDLGPMLTVPVQFLDDNKGAINVYRARSEPPFDDDSLQLLSEAARVIPVLLHATRDRIGFDLLGKVDEVIRTAEIAGKGDVLSKRKKRVYLVDICRHVAESFRCLEVSIFLEDPDADPNWFELQATTWSEGIEKRGYFARAEEGVTGWILQHMRSVRVFDLRGVTRDATRSTDLYPGLYWKRSEKFIAQVRRLFNTVEEHGMPPLSYMAAPIVLGDRVQGVIRCCTARSSPYFYSDRELKLLELIAAQVAQCWSSWLNRRKLVNEREKAFEMVKATSELNALVQATLATQGVQSQVLARRMLEVISEHVPEADALDVRFYDARADELYIAVTHGKEWSKGTDDDRARRLSLRFPIGDRKRRPNSIGAYVFRKPNQLYHQPDLSRDPYYKNSGCFANAHSLVSVAIVVGKKVFGVLDIFAMGEKGLPKGLLPFAELFGKQLGLYLSLTQVLDDLRDAEQKATANVRALEEVQQQQQRVFEDLSHQLKGPVRLARRRSETALDRASSLDPLRTELQTLRGLLRKADRVTRSLRFLTEIDQGKAVSVERSTLDESRLLPMLIETAQDTAFYAGPNRSVRFDVDRMSFRTVPLRRVMLDYDLLEQAVSNLCDNAAKYSFENSVVRIYGGVTAGGRFHISVENRGLKIRPHQLALCVQRYWRSDEAVWTTGEGSGIGLWIVDNIMKSHGGQLIIEPTNDDGLTTVKLVFPLGQVQ